VRVSVIVGEAVGKDINPAYDDHEYAAHEADEERYLKNMSHEDNDSICHRIRGGIVATERLLKELPYVSSHMQKVSCATPISAQP
jgi:hypothetical protein